MQKSFFCLILLLLLIFNSSIAQEVTLYNGSATDVGMSQTVLDSAVQLYKDVIQKEGLRGAVLLVARNGKVVLFEAIGWLDFENKLPMEKSTMFRMASNTKPIIATAIAMLEEQDKLQYHDFVKNFIPSFDNEKAASIKIEHLLTHSSGFRIHSLFLEPLMKKSAQHPDAPNLQLEVARFGEIGAEEKPGTTFEYSNPGFNTLGALIEIASGQSLESFLMEKIYRPLGMSDSYNHEIAEKLDGKLNRMAVVYEKHNDVWQPRWSPGDPPTLPFVRASGGMIATAWDYAIFCQMFLNKGIYNGVRILKPETVAIMTSPQTKHIYSEEQQKARDSFYGYGWFVTKDGIYSHGGSDGTFAWVDPEDQIVGLVFTQSPGGNNPKTEFMKLVKISILK